MAVIQSTYSQYFEEGLAGNPAYTSGLLNWVSKITDTAIEFGLGVVRGAQDRSVMLPAATGGDFVGVVRRTLAGSNSDNEATAATEEGTFWDIITNGTVYVVCEDGCSPGDAVYLRHTANGDLTAGGFRTDADTDTADMISNATWESTTEAGGIAILKLNQGV